MARTKKPESTSLAARLDIVRAKHPYRDRWLQDESRMRASYLATRRHLAPFLVPHRFEGNQKPEELRRAGYGYAIGLNRAYLAEIVGHVTSAEATYQWGPLGPTEATTEPPTDGTAAELWRDATRSGHSWPQFFTGTVLEWMLSSVGGFIVVDVPAIPTATQADETAAGKRPYVRWVPWSAVEDFGMGPDGLRWIQFAEIADQRQPGGASRGTNTGLVRQHVLYELEAESARATRYDDDGRVVDTAEFGRLIDRRGRPTLPIVKTGFGEHPDLAALNAGLLLGLDDIVIDLFNLVSETREGFRDAAFGVITYNGPDAEAVRTQLQEGSRFIPLGDIAGSKLERVAADPAEAQTGLELITTAITAWALAAKRNAKEAQDTNQARSGLSLVAEFQLDLKPLLVSVTGALDDTESSVMFIAAQLAGETPDPTATGVTRNTEFRLEDEASRISRIVSEFTRSLDLPAEAVAQITMRWLESSGVLGDLEAKAATEGGNDPSHTGKGQTVRERLEQQVHELADAKQRQRVRETEFEVPGFGVPQV